jgi:hypothetical protein
MPIFVKFAIQKPLLEILSPTRTGRSGFKTLIRAAYKRLLQEFAKLGVEVILRRPVLSISLRMRCLVFLGLISGKVARSVESWEYVLRP